MRSYNVRLWKQYMNVRLLIFQQWGKMCCCRVAVGVAVLCILSTVNIPFRSHMSDLCPRGVIISFLFSLEPVYHSTFLFWRREIALKIASILFFSQDMRAKLSSCLWYQNYDYVWNMFVDVEKKRRGEVRKHNWFHNSTSHYLLEPG